MKTEPGENLKSRTQYSEEAIQLAIDGRWDDAVKLNREILDKFGPDEDANNRLGKAFTELGQLDQAKKAYAATLAINQFNVIARKNVSKLDVLLQAKANLKGGPVKVDLNLFVEEMGKTAITQLEDVTDKDVCDKVVAGDVAELRLEGPALVVETLRGVRLGVVESKLARRVIKFMQGGNRYQAGVTSCEGGQVRVIIREVYQDSKFAGKPSFPMKRQRATEFRPYAKESLIPRSAPAFGEDEDEEEGALESASEEYEGMRVDDEESGGMEFSEEGAEEDLGIEIEDDGEDDSE